MIAPGQIESDVPHAIQLALAPIFLLTGMAGLLNVMANRLGRIIDRTRRLVESPDHAGVSPAARARELHCLERRRRFANAAITACTASALLVCVVILALFVEALLSLPLKWFAGVLFAAATIALICGLAMFLREVHLANRSAAFELRPPRQDQPASALPNLPAASGQEMLPNSQKQRRREIPSVRSMPTRER